MRKLQKLRRKIKLQMNIKKLWNNKQKIKKYNYFVENSQMICYIKCIRIGERMNKKSIRLILIEIVILIIAILGVNSNLINYAPECTFYKITNLQCPSCGGTRCVESILKGQFKEAFLFHPIFFITIVYLLLCNIVYLINLNKKDKIMTWIYPKYWYVIIFAIVLVVYTILRNLI